MTYFFVVCEAAVIYKACEKCSAQQVMNRVEFVNLLLQEVSNLLARHTHMDNLSYHEKKRGGTHFRLDNHCLFLFF